MARKKEQDKTNQRLLHAQERLSDLLEDIRDEADGVNTGITTFTTDKMKHIDSERTLETARKILSFSTGASIPAAKRDLYLNYLYCYMITASIKFTVYEASEQNDEPYGPGTFRDLLEEDLNMYEGVFGMNAFHMIVLRGNIILRLLTGKRDRYVVPVEDWAGAKKAVAAYSDDVWSDSTGMTEDELDQWNKAIDAQSEVKGVRTQSEERTEEELALLNKQEGERLRMRFPGYKEYVKRMKKLDKQQHEMDGAFSDRIKQMVRAFLSAEGYSLYSDEDHYVEIMVYLRRVLKACGGTIG